MNYVTEKYRNSVDLGMAASRSSAENIELSALPYFSSVLLCTGLTPREIFPAYQLLIQWFENFHFPVVVRLSPECVSNDCQVIRPSLNVFTVTKEMEYIGLTKSRRGTFPTRKSNSVTKPW